MTPVTVRAMPEAAALRGRTIDAAIAARKARMGRDVFFMLIHEEHRPPAKVTPNRGSIQSSGGYASWLPFAQPGDCGGKALGGSFSSQPSYSKPQHGKRYLSHSSRMPVKLIHSAFFG